MSSILVCGSGLAAQMTVTALSRQLPESIKIIWAKGALLPTEIFYGNTTSATAYAFNLSMGVEETALVLNTTTAFSFGTEYVRWVKRSWVQSFQQPMPVLDGVLFHHYLTRLKLTGIEPFHVSAVAGKAGRFAHPPESGDHPLVKAEYGYQFDLPSYTAAFAAAADMSHLEVIEAEVQGTENGEFGLTAVHLSNGQTLSADLYVDCTGPEARLLSTLPGRFEALRPLRGYFSRRPAQTLGAPLRRLTAHDFGWQSDTPVQGANLQLTVCAPADSAAAQSAHGDAEITSDITTGRQDTAWRDNCVAIGQAAGVLEPLSPAPYILLQQDVSRLMSLLPYDAADMSVERKDFNRLFRNHFDHVQLFNDAFFTLEDLPSAAYWQDAKDHASDPRLKHKTEQFSSRGLHVSYDDELFNQEDWIILHYGLRHVPGRYEYMAERANADKVKTHLIHLQNQIETSVKAMPTHDQYMSGLRRYLTQQKD